MVHRDRIKHCCDLAIQNVIKEGITDVELFSRPFELDYLKNQTVKSEIQSTVVDAIYQNDFSALKIRKLGHVLVPKKDLCDYRKCAIIDIIDEITYLTLTLLVAKPIEEERINASKNRVFSYRYRPEDGYLFHPHYHFTSFRSEVSRKARVKTNHVLVECDISNFYDRLNIHRIESALLSFEKTDNDIVRLINELLLYWANRDSYGLPVGSNASRILAEASLINVDRYLWSHNVDYCRFVDDFRIFAKDAETAHKHLTLLTHCLSREGLFINTSKTRMKDIHDLTAKDDAQTAAVALPAQDAEEVREPGHMPKIIRGYSGLIPTKFREPSEREKEALCAENLSACICALQAAALVEPNEVKQGIKMIAAQKAYDQVDQLPPVLKKFPQFIPYFVDFIGRYQSEISSDKIDAVIAEFSDLFSQDDVPEYILVYLVRLFSIGKSGKTVLLKSFRNLRRTAGSYIGRALLESFNGKLSRTEAIEIRESFVRSDDWEKRQILRLVQNTLPEEEKRAFFKDISIHSADLLVPSILSKKEELLKVTKFTRASQH